VGNAGRPVVGLREPQFRRDGPKRSSGLKYLARPTLFIVGLQACPFRIAIPNKIL